MELTPLGYLVLIALCIGISFAAYQLFFYDEHQQDPGYCSVYARQYLNDWKTPLPYSVKENVARESCTTPHWDFICRDRDENNEHLPQCWVARSEPKFQILGVNP